MHKNFKTRKGKKRDQEEKRKEDHHEFFLKKRSKRFIVFILNLFIYFIFLVFH